MLKKRLKEVQRNFENIFTTFPKNCPSTLKKSLRNSEKIFETHWLNFFNILEQLWRGKNTKVLKKLQGNNGIILRALQKKSSKNCETFDKILEKFGETLK